MHKIAYAAATSILQVIQPLNISCQRIIDAARCRGKCAISPVIKSATESCTLDCSSPFIETQGEPSIGTIDSRLSDNGLDAPVQRLGFCEDVLDLRENREIHSVQVSDRKRDVSIRKSGDGVSRLY